MACFHPLTAYQLGDGSVVFSERGDVRRTLSLPCGQCVGCRLERSRQWALRCVHEASLHKDNSFITLTYDDKHLPPRSSLDYGDFQRFMKRLRKRVDPIRPRFYMCGEYGEDFNRPHFHACLFGFAFPDRKFWRRGPSGSRVYRSELLEDLWPFGFSSIGEVTFESAAYVARYCMKKINGDLAESHYSRVDLDTGEIYQVTPEFNHMSLKPGIGAGWLEKYMTDVYPHDYVISRGKEVKPPKFYDRKFSELHPFEWEALQFRRDQVGRARYFDNTEERLSDKEICAKAALSVFRRSIE